VSQGGEEGFMPIGECNPSSSGGDEPHNGEHGVEAIKRIATFRTEDKVAGTLRHAADGAEASDGIPKD
jgi:hypothetical protein